MSFQIWHISKIWDSKSFTNEERVANTYFSVVYSSNRYLVWAKTIRFQEVKKIIMPKFRCAYLGVIVSSRILNVTDYSKTYTSSFIDWFFFFWISGSKNWVHLFLQSCNIFLVGPPKTPFLFHFLFHSHFLLTPPSKL